MKLFQAKSATAFLAGIAAFTLLAAGIAFISVSTGIVPISSKPASHADLSSQKAAQQALEHMPLAFEANRGQTDGRVDFLTRGPGYVAFLSSTESVLKLAGPDRQSPAAALKMQLSGANPAAKGSASSRLPGKVNYFTAGSPEGLKNLSTYAKVNYRGVYPGIDMTYYGNQRQLEYDFHVAPGADPGAIKLNFKGADRLTVQRGGDLKIAIGDRNVVQHKPRIYQITQGHKQNIPGHFRLAGKTVGFQVGAYNRSLPLVIDPVLSYRSYLGGGGADIGFGVAVDSAGAAYVTGSTQSTNYPTIGAVTGCTGTFTTTSLQCDKGLGDAFVTKINDGGATIAWSTYLGGSKEELGWDVAVDSSGNVYVAGSTESADLPTTANAFDTTCGTDGTCNAPVPGGQAASDSFLAKLTPAGDSLAYSTYLGGSDVDLDTNPASGALGDMDIAVRGSVAYITAATGSSDFPTTTTGDRYCGTTGAATGCNLHNDGYLSLLDTSKSGAASLVFSTYIGGSGDDQGKGVAVDSKGDAYVAGITFGFPVNPADPTSRLVDDFPSTSTVGLTYNGGASDGFVAKFATSSIVANASVSGSVGLGSAKVKASAGAGSLVYATYLGGGGADEAWDVDVNGTNAYVTGYTESGDDPATPAADGPTPYFPVTPGAFDTTYNGRPYAPDGSTAFLAGDVFVSELTPAGDGLVYSTYLGGHDGDVGMGIDVDSTGAAYVTGYTHCETPVRHVGPIVSSIQIGFPQSGNGTQRIGTATTSTSAIYTVHARATGSNAGAADPLDLPAGTQVTLTATPDPVTGKSVVFSNATNTITVTVDANGNAADTLTPVDATSAGIAVISAELVSNPGTKAAGIAEWGYPAPQCTSDFPTTAGAPQPAINGDFLGMELHNSPADPFVTKLNPAGSGLVYSTYLGGNDFDRGYAIAVRETPAGNEAYITGRTGSTLIGTAGSAVSTKPSGKGNRDAYIAKVTD